MGHLSRCIELSKNLKKFNLNPYFLIENESLTKKIIKETNLNYFTIDRFIEKNLVCTLQRLKNEIDFSGIVIDSRKNFSSEFFLEINKLSKTIVIWNEKNFENFNANLVILPEIWE